MKYYIADIHFGHKNILKFENRPFKTIEEMNEEYIKRWNNKIKKGDEVYILGDLSFYKGEDTNKILRRLNGMKFLIKGNHDHLFLNDEKFDQSLFRWIKDTAMIKDEGHKILLFHYPIQVWNERHYGALHFYGHIHSNTIRYNIPNSYNVGIDVIQEPMTKDEILNFYERRK